MKKIIIAFIVGIIIGHLSLGLLKAGRGYSDMFESDVVYLLEKIERNTRK